METSFYLEKHHGFIRSVKNVIPTNIYIYHRWHFKVCDEWHLVLNCIHKTMCGHPKGGSGNGSNISGFIFTINSCCSNRTSYVSSTHLPYHYYHHKQKHQQHPPLRSHHLKTSSSLRWVKNWPSKPLPWDWNLPLSQDPNLAVVLLYILKGK